MVTIVTTRPCPAETGGGMWNVGETRSVSTRYAEILIGRGDAYDPTGAIKDIGGSGVVTLASGVPGFVYAGTDYPLAFLVGTPQEGFIAGTRNLVVEIDNGNDTAHTEILVTFNCYTVDPDTSDDALAATRFANYLTDAVDVWRTGLSGGTTSGAYYLLAAPTGTTYTLVHFAMVDATSKTLAAGNTVGPTTMVLVKVPNSYACKYLEIAIGSATGVNGRHRQIAIKAFA